MLGFKQSFFRAASHTSPLLWLGSGNIRPQKISRPPFRAD